MFLTACSELINHAELQPHHHIIALRDAYLMPHHLAVVMDYAGAKPSWRNPPCF